MTTDWPIAVLGLGLVALIVTATVLMVRHREQMRAADREAESLNVLSNDTRRAFGTSAADRSKASDSSSSSGGGGDDD
jgi:hypothetical protein